MTKGNGKLRSLLIRAGACLVVALAIGSMAGGAYAEGDGGKGRDGHEREHDKKHTGRTDGDIGVHELLARFEGNHLSAGSTSGGSSGGKGNYGSCSRC